jgi:hypothetical protein
VTVSCQPPKIPHAIPRLRERYGVAVDMDQWNRIKATLADPERRKDPSVLRRALPNQYHCRGHGFEVWWINLEPISGHKVWAKALFLKNRGIVVTFLPREAPRIPREMRA